MTESGPVPSSRRYAIRLDFTAANDHQAERLAEAWADTCAAEYGTTYRGLVRLSDGAILVDKEGAMSGRVPSHDGAWCPTCNLPQRYMRDFVAECDNGHRWDRRRPTDGFVYDGSFDLTFLCEGETVTSAADATGACYIEQPTGPGTSRGQRIDIGDRVQRLASGLVLAYRETPPVRPTS